MDTQNIKKINFGTKSQLAKLIASENITVQHNQVKTASFDTLNRILTLPIFKVQSGDVYDMLIAHECAHALWTPQKAWADIADDNELRSYVNVLEDCRIDKKIQNKYPGVVRNYLNGFDIMDKQDFFGIKDRDINTDLMLIDKINLYYKSSKRLPFIFTPSDKLWLSKVDNLKSFKDVVDLAKKLLDWQKKEVKKLKKLPGFDNHILVENYKLSDEESDNNVNSKDVKDSDKQDSKSESSNDDSKDGDNDNKSEQDTKEESDDKTNDTDVKASNPDGAGGEGGLEPGLSAITDKTFELAKEKLLDTETRFTYVNLPEPNLKNIMYSNKKWLETWKKYRYYKLYGSKDRRAKYLTWLKNDYNKFKNDNKKTVMYLVKEFEMKKSATAYKRATTDKTGIIDPLKLSEYKYNDDIFKKLTILPDAKNHGMIMLLDWSGSMSDVIKQTIDQLLNLIWFCQKINIPYEVYLFTSEVYSTIKDSRSYRNDLNGGTWNYKHGDGIFENFHLINVASHKLRKKELDESLMYLYHLGLEYENRYTRYDFNAEDKGDEMGCPPEFYLGTTPLNESLVVMNKIIPMFKRKYNIEKLTFITLTDGSSNSNYYINTIENTENGLKESEARTGSPVIKVGKKQFSLGRSLYGNVTPLLLNVLKDTHGINTIGFYLAKRMRTWDMDRYIDRDKYKTWDARHQAQLDIKKQFNKEKCAIVSKNGYNKYFVINGKTMKVENTDLSAVNDNMKAGKIKQLFSKSMKGRIVSRTLLNKFIEEVA